MAFFNEMGTRVKLRMTAHKIRLNPTPEQEQYLRQACGVARHAFNWGLAEWMLDPSGQSWLKQ